MADTLDLGSSALGVRVQVPPLAFSACKFFCGNSSVVERHLAKVDVAGPTPVFRFLKLRLVVVKKQPMTFSLSESTAFCCILMALRMMPFGEIRREFLCFLRSKNASFASKQKLIARSFAEWRNFLRK